MPRIGPPFCVCPCRAFHCPCPVTVNSAEQGLSHCSVCTAGGSDPDVYLKLLCTAVTQIIVLQKAASKIGEKIQIHCNKFYAFLRVGVWVCLFIDPLMLLVGLCKKWRQIYI